MEAWEATIAKKHDDQFYADILKFVAGEPNGIRSGTVGETQALIAKRLVAEEPGLVVPERRAELMEKISSIYDRDHAVYVTLSDADIALACLTAHLKKRPPRVRPPVNVIRLRSAHTLNCAPSSPKDLRSPLVLVPRVGYPSTTWRLLRTAHLSAAFASISIEANGLRKSKSKERPST